MARNSRRSGRKPTIRITELSPKDRRDWGAQAVDQIRVDRAAIEARVQAQVASWRALLTESVEDGRTLLRELLSGPLVFTRKGAGYHFRAPIVTGELIVGAINDGAHKVASPTGLAIM